MNEIPALISRGFTVAAKDWALQPDEAQEGGDGAPWNHTRAHAFPTQSMPR